MANNQENGNAKLSVWDKICAFYASQSTAVGMVYSLGAAVVIVGALFKILHLPGASQMLFVGMMTEALLFTMGIFEKPHAAYNWENVFPQLIGHDPQPLNNMMSGAGASSNGGAAIDAADTKALKESIANLAATANGFAEINKLAETSKGLNDKLAAASEAANKFAGAQMGVAEAADKLGQNYVAAAAVAENLKADAEAAAKNQAAVKENIAALNAAYELNLKAAQAGAAEAQKCAAEAQKGAEAAAAYAAAQDKLAKQVADLNKVYGNMLNAIA